MLEVTDDTFERDVLDRSTEVPVVVDLWAEWCGPCRTLGPILERVVGATDGKVELVKVDVDANPRVASTFQVLQASGPSAPPVVRDQPALRSCAAKWASRSRAESLVLATASEPQRFGPPGAPYAARVTPFGA